MHNTAIPEKYNIKPEQRPRGCYCLCEKVNFLG